MEKKKQTTVNLNIQAQSIKEDLAPIYGLKNILSAGLILFNRLSETEREDFVRWINLPVPSPQQAARDDESAAARLALGTARNPKARRRAAKPG